MQIFTRFNGPILSRLGTTAVFFGYWGHGSEVKKNWREPAAVVMETVSQVLSFCFNC
jgi:hypothetical protein